VLPQVAHVTRPRRHEQVALRAVAARMPHYLIENAEERDRVQRHLYAGRGGKLRPDATHALAGRPLAQVRLPFDDYNAAASRFRQVIGYARTDNSPADNNYIRRLQTPSLGLASAHTFY